jgi:hypothetical protein
MNMTLLLKGLGLFSFVAFVGSLIAVPWMIGRMRADYFLTHWQEVDVRHRRHPLVASALSLLRNGIGLCLLIAGIAMLVLPGQGILTILIAICLMDIPGKRRLIDRLVAVSQVQQALNWIRRKRGKTEFVFVDEGHKEELP